MSKNKYPSNAVNVTRYARANGYSESRDVFCAEGKVVSHGNIDWAEFCHQSRIEAFEKETAQRTARGASS